MVNLKKLIREAFKKNGGGVWSWVYVTKKHQSLKVYILGV